MGRPPGGVSIRRLPIALLAASAPFPVLASVRADDGTDDMSADDLLVNRGRSVGKLGDDGWPMW